MNAKLEQLLDVDNESVPNSAAERIIPVYNPFNSFQKSVDSSSFTY
jgi:hypothetical protein